MLTVYCYNKCSTCRKALRWLEEKGVQAQVLDLKETHPDAEALRDYVARSGLPLKRFFNTSGQRYRELGLAQRLPALAEEEQLALLAEDGMLVKRPLLIGEGFVLPGFREADWEAALGL